MISEQQLQKIRDFAKSCRWGWEEGDHLKHTEEVVKHALWLQEKFGGRKDIIEAAAWLHDVGKTKLRTRQKIGEYEDTHEPISAEMAEEFLEKIGIGEAERMKVISAIKNHGKYGKNIPEIIEDKVVCIADKMAIMTDSVKRRVADASMSKEDAFKLIEAGKSIFKDIGVFNGAQERVRGACEAKLKLLESRLK